MRLFEETTRTVESKLGWSKSLNAHFEKELRAHFGEAWITVYESLIPGTTNDEKDRHAAIGERSAAEGCTRRNEVQWRKPGDTGVEAGGRT